MSRVHQTVFFVFLVMIDSDITVSEFITWRKVLLTPGNQWEIHRKIAKLHAKYSRSTAVYEGSKELIISSPAAVKYDLLDRAALVQ